MIRDLLTSPVVTVIGLAAWAYCAGALRGTRWSIACALVAAFCAIAVIARVTT